MTQRFTATILFALILTANLTACSYIQELKLPIITQTGESLPVQTEDGATIKEDLLVDPATYNLTPRYYPDTFPIADPLDILILRDGNAIILDNRTVNSFTNVQIWLNHEFGADVEKIAIGRNSPINLRSFVNQHAEVYPVARFLAPDADRPLVLVDIAINGKIHKLHVRLEDWRHP